MVEPVSSPIADFFKDRSIFITGASGFLGKVLLEKLLRSCNQIKTIYVLLRPKRGQEPKERLENLFKFKVFERVLKEQPECISKVVPIPGDMTLPGLGISASDEALLISNVSVVFHSAASIKFDEPLKKAIQMNVVGTQSLVQLCHKMPHLESLVHVSTAFVQCHLDEVEERVYDSPVDPKRVIDTIDWMDDDMVNMITPRLLDGRPNTYTYAKALAETLLLEESKTLPVAVVRPSIVISTWKEPIPGWADNFNGPIGIIAGISKGVLRSTNMNPSYTGDVIPVDVVINLMITVAWYTATHRPGKLVIYNCCSGKINRITQSEFGTVNLNQIMRYPPKDLFFYPSINYTDNRLLYQLRITLNHLIPAYIVDFLATATGRKPQLVTMYSKIHKATDCLSFFTTHECKFSYQNVPSLLEKVSPEDKQVFDFDISTLKWSEYAEGFVLGIRQFLFKDDLSSLPRARKNLKRKYIMTKVAHLILLFLLWKVVVMMF